MLTLIRLAAFCLVLVVVFATHFLFKSSANNVFSVASMLAICAMLTGALFGFLFGIPRTLQQDHSDSAKAGSSTEKESTYQANTNLEQISDWLTKILLGAGLAEAGRLRDWLWTFSKTVAVGFGSDQTRGAVFAATTICSFVLLGFFLGYLWTRFYLAGILREADLAALARQVEEIKEKTDQFELDAQALSLALRQLSPSKDSVPPTQDEIDKAIEKASPRIMRQIFLTASDSRVENRELRKDRMQATIPVFLALMHADRGKKFHEHFGEVGFAYKDQERPQFKEAEDALTQAIQIRGSWQKHNFVLYELNRAICRIQLENEKVEKGIKSTAASKAAILEDLRVLSVNKEMAKQVLEGKDRENTAIREWMKHNDIDPEKAFELASG